MKVRFLSVQQIEAAVAELLRNFAATIGRAVEAPVPIEDILEKHLKLKLEIKDLVKFLGIADVLGAVWFEEAIVRIDERLLEQEGRFCFTVGHELGHWILHRSQVQVAERAPSLFGSGDGPPTFVCRTAERRAPAEWQADQFSALLLMPSALVRSAFIAECGSAVVIDGLKTRRDDADVISKWRDVAAAVRSKGRFSNVSNEAMRYRLADLGLVRPPDGSQTSLLV